MMTGLTVSFGNGGDSLQYALTSADPNYVGDALALNGGSYSDQPSGEGVGDVITTTSVDVASVGANSGTGGSVSIGYLSNGSFNFDVDGAWNSVKNALAQSDHNESLTFKDFVQVDAYLGNGGDSFLEIDNVKRGTIATGDGNDTIKLSLLTNDSSWQNQFNISSGDGNDSIVLTQGSASSANAKATSTIDGHLTTLTLDTGAGNDTIDLSAVKLKVANVTGGAGNDTIYASQGNDTFHYSAIAGGNNGDDHIYGFKLGADHLSLDGGITVADSHAHGGNLTLYLSDDSSVTLHGVTSADNLFV
jgi:Ca2+-binding RTX toxin-like protein